MNTFYRINSPVIVILLAILLFFGDGALAYNFIVNSIEVAMIVGGLSAALWLIFCLTILRK